MGMGTHHDEHQVGKLAQRGVLSKGLDQGGNILLRIRPGHGQNGRLAGVSQEPENFLQGRNFTQVWNLLKLQSIEAYPSKRRHPDQKAFFQEIGRQPAFQILPVREKHLTIFD